MISYFKAYGIHIGQTCMHEHRLVSRAVACARRRGFDHILYERIGYRYVRTISGRIIYRQDHGDVPAVEKY
jgi:hypothetical protein